MARVLIAHANSAANQWLAWVVASSLDVAIVGGLFWLVWLAIRRRIAPQVGYLLFLLIPLKLLVPVVATLPESFARFTPSGIIGAWLEKGGTSEIIAAHSGETMVAPPAKFVAGAMPHSVNVALVPSPFFAPPPEIPRLSSTAFAFLFWLMGVIGLSSRLIFKQLTFRSRLNRAARLDPTRHPADFDELCHLAGIRRAVCVVEDDTIAAPAVFGLRRPTIILPRGILQTLSRQQRRWLLLHELAHVKRGDLWMIVLQRIAAILHFFNPIIWLTNGMIHRLREYACDDMALVLSKASAIESSEAFIGVLRHVDRSHQRIEGALGIFGLDSRAACFGRMRRLLDTERIIRIKPGALSVLGLILLAIIFLPTIRSGHAAQPEPQAPAAKPAVVTEVAGKEFSLRVVGPDGKPIPEALVDFRGNPPLEAKQVRVGTFVKKREYSSQVKCDAQGSLVVTLPKSNTDLTLEIDTPGFGPYWANWAPETKFPNIPEHFTAELDRAWTVGGVIVDPEGKPVKGVKLNQYIKYKKPPGDDSVLYSGAIQTTDEAGKWHYDHVPNALGRVYVDINHPDFRPTSTALARGTFEVAKGSEPTAKTILNRGLTVTGKVTDEEGKPIADALIRTKFVNTRRQAKTGADGVYKLIGCEPRSTRIVISASGKAVDMKIVSVEPDMTAVDFRMKPGGKIRVRVVDANGKPAPDARIFLQHWRGHVDYFEFEHVNMYANKNGMWAWDEAPLDEFQADICPQHDEGIQLPSQPLIARNDEYVFKFPPPLVVAGKVYDAETKAPIKSFIVTPGDRLAMDQLAWIEQDQFPSSDGKYRIQRDRVTKILALRIDAQGYHTEYSREILMTEGSVTLDFAMKRGAGFSANVFTPGGKPASGAEVALGIDGSQLSMINGVIDRGQTYSPRTKTNDAGLFSFSTPANSTKLVVITHESGYLFLTSKYKWEAENRLTLKPWARVEGTYKIGKKPVDGVIIEVESHPLDTEEIDDFRTHVIRQQRAATGPDGRFAFDRVIPGNGNIGRSMRFMVGQGYTEVTSTPLIATAFPRGKITKIDMGGSGRAVVGKLLAPEGFKEKPRWSFAMVYVSQTKEQRPIFKASIHYDGTFRIDDMPPGDYILTVSFQEDLAGILRGYPFNVPHEPAEQPVDLGPIRLQPSPTK